MALRSRFLSRLFALSLPLTCAAPAALAEPKAAPPAPARPNKVSDERDRKEVSLTVYNSNFALVREVRRLEELGRGQVDLEFQDVAATIQPETVAVKPESSGLRVLEQNYRFDLLTPEKLLEKYVGRTIKAYRYHESTGREDAVDAKLLSVTGGQILQIGNEITFGYPARLAFPEVPANLIAKPTLMWLVDNQAAAAQTLEVSYLAQGLSWNADYVLVVNDADTKADLVGWVTLTNNSGSSYRAAELKLVAGDVNRVRDVMARPMMAKSASRGADAGNAFREEGLLEYHMYTLGRPADVLDREQKQVTLLEAAGLGIKKRLVFSGEQYFFQGQYGELQKNQKVSVFLDFENSEKNRMGMPLPRGTLRVYKADRAGKKQFVGEDAIDHTPRDEKLHIKVGEAFDVVADRKQVEWRALGNCNSESSWEIELRNHKDENVSVEVREPAGGDFTIVESSHPATKESSTLFTFDVNVPKRGKTKLTYRARVRWC